MGFRCSGKGELGAVVRRASVTKVARLQQLPRCQMRGRPRSGRWESGGWRVLGVVKSLRANMALIGGRCCQTRGPKSTQRKEGGSARPRGIEASRIEGDKVLRTCVCEGGSEVLNFLTTGNPQALPDVELRPGLQPPSDAEPGKDRHHKCPQHPPKSPCAHPYRQTQRHTHTPSSKSPEPTKNGRGHQRWRRSPTVL